MKVMVLGATGMLGGYCALALRKAGHDVVACGRRQSDNGFFHLNGCQYIGGITLQDNGSFRKIPRDIHAVVHMAGTMPAHADASPLPYAESIVIGMINLLEWLRGTSCRRIVFNTTPSDVCNFFGTDVPVEDDAPRSFPKDGGDHAVYAICKNAASDILEHYHIAYDFKPIIFRHLTVYGWHPDATYHVNGVTKILPWRQIMRKCIAGELVEVWGDATRKKELLYIDDFTSAIRIAVENDVCGLFNLPGDRPYTLDEQIQGLIDVFSPKAHPSRKIYCPEKPSTPQNLLSGEKAKTILGWHASITWQKACQLIRSAICSNGYGQLWGCVPPEERISSDVTETTIMY